MGKRKRPNRTTDMDDALFEALKSSVPPKDTGPDPDDILGGLFDDDEESSNEPSREAGGGLWSLTIELDDIDRERAEQIVKIVRKQTGEQIDFAQAIKIALFNCPLDEQKVLMAYGMMGARSRDHE